VDRGLLRPKTEVGWCPVAGDKFPTEGTGKTVVFLAHIERGFGVPAGDFIRGLLFFCTCGAGTSGAKLDHHHFYLYPLL
jgi:hypothetical protein